MNIKKYIHDFLLCQLVVTLVSLPILVFWGLPLSLMSIVGNLIFLPFLTLFLLLSSIIFFTELLFIPNGIFTISLDFITEWWLYFLHYGKKEWLIGFSHPKILSAIILIQIAINIFLHRKIKRYLLTANYAALVIILVTFTLATRVTKETKFFIPDSQEKLFIETHCDNTITLTDHGFFSKKTSPEKAVLFDFRPYLTQKFGTITIKELIEKRPGQRSFRAIGAICSLLPVKKIKLAYFKSKLNKNGWRAFFEMKRELSKQGVTLERFTLRQRRNQRRNSLSLK
jgi:hypothetical protein